MNTSPLRTRKSSSKTLGQEYPKALPSPMVSVWHYEKTACLMCYVFGREMRLEEPFSLVHAPSISEAVTQGSSVLWDNEVYSRHIEEGLRVIVCLPPRFIHAWYLTAPQFTPSSGCALSLTPPTTYPTSPYNHPSNYHYPGGIPSDFEWTYSPASCSASEAMRIFAPGSEIEMIEIVPTACDQFISPTSSSCHTMVSISTACFVHPHLHLLFRPPLWSALMSVLAHHAITALLLALLLTVTMGKSRYATLCLFGFFDRF